MSRYEINTIADAEEWLTIEENQWYTERGITEADETFRYQETTVTAFLLAQLIDSDILNISALEGLYANDAKKGRIYKWEMLCLKAIGWHMLPIEINDANVGYVLINNIPFTIEAIELAFLHAHRLILFIKELLDPKNGHTVNILMFFAALSYLSKERSFQLR